MTGYDSAQADFGDLDRHLDAAAPSCFRTTIFYWKRSAVHLGSRFIRETRSQRFMFFHPIVFCSEMDGLFEHVSLFVQPWLRICFGHNQPELRDGFAVSGDS